MNLDKGQVGCSICKGGLYTWHPCVILRLVRVPEPAPLGRRLRLGSPMRFNWSNPQLSDAFSRLPHSCAHQFGNIWKYRREFFIGESRLTTNPRPGRQERSGEGAGGQRDAMASLKRSGSSRDNDRKHKATLAKLRQEASNATCVDCKSNTPTWAR